MMDWVIAFAIFGSVGTPALAYVFAYWDLGRRKNAAQKGEGILSTEIQKLREELVADNLVLSNRVTEANMRISACERNIKDALGSRPAKTTVPIMPFGSKQQR